MSAESALSVCSVILPAQAAGALWKPKSLRSVLEPQAKIVAGYEPVMPTYQGRLKDEEITVIIAYIKSLDEVPEEGEQEPS